MAVQAILGLLFPGAYYDADWIRAAWYGNDWVTLLLAVPMLSAGLWLASRGSMRGLLLWLGMLWYGVYNYAFYMLGVAINIFFPLYVVGVILSAISLILALLRIDVERVAASFGSGTPVRIIGGYLVFVAVGLTAVWLGMWAAFVFAGRGLPPAPDPFRLVASLDLTLMVPALSIGGVLLWRRNAWGYAIAAIASIQGGLYLLVLTVNAAIMIRRGLAEAPAELPVWGPLAVATAVAAAVLLSNVHTEPSGK